MKIVIKICKFVYCLSISTVNLLGFAFLCILVAYSIVYIKGIAITDTRWNLSPMITHNLVYFWIVAWVVFVLGMFVSIGYSIKKYVAKAIDASRDKTSEFTPSSPQKNMWVELAKWLLSH